MKVRMILLFAGLSLATSCNQTQSNIVTVNLDRPDISIDVKLSDMLSDITIVPLETRNDILLSGAQMLTVAVTDQYIIIANENALHQFDKTGKYIKQLAVQGNGPNEFLGIRSLLPDNYNNILYYKDNRDRNTLLCLDMHTGAFLPPHIFDVHNFSIIAADDEGMIYGFPMPAPMILPLPSRDSLTMAYRYNPKEQVVTRFQQEREFPPRFAFGNTMCYYKEELFFMYMCSDTLYRVTKNNEPVPAFYLIYADRKVDFNSNGNYFRILFKYNDGLVVQKCMHEIDLMRNGWSETNQPAGYYLIDNESRPKMISSLLIDPLQLSVPIKINENQISPNNTFPFPYIQGQWGYIIMEAMRVMAMINESLAGGQLSQEQRKQLETLAATLEEDSNPVLIIGKLR